MRVDSPMWMLSCPAREAQVMETLDETLCERVDEAIRSHKRPILSTTGPMAAIGELGSWSQGLEEAIREIALEVQKLAARDGVSATSRVRSL